jgi:hypothetical protein
LSTGLPCPHRIENKGCIFCNPANFVDPELSSCNSITEQINYLSSKLSRKFGNIGFSAYFQDNTSTFGNIDYLNNLFLEADSHPLINEIVISTRPDFINQEILNSLKLLNKDLTIELGIQTIHDKSLLFLNRGHTQSDNQNAVNLLNDFQIRTGAHLVLGIPNESNDDILNTIDWLKANKIKEVKFHHLVVYKDTPLELIYRNSPFNQAYSNLDNYCLLMADILGRLSNECVVSRFFTSNLIQDQTSLNQFPGIKKNWLNKLTKTLNELDIIQNRKS